MLLAVSLVPGGSPSRGPPSDPRRGYSVSWECGVPGRFRAEAVPGYCERVLVDVEAFWEPGWPNWSRVGPKSRSRDADRGLSMSMSRPRERERDRERDRRDCCEACSDFFSDGGEGASGLAALDPLS